MSSSDNKNNEELIKQIIAERQKGLILINDALEQGKKNEKMKISRKSKTKGVEKEEKEKNAGKFRKIKRKKKNKKKTVKKRKIRNKN